VRNRLGEGAIALAQLPKREQNPALTPLFYFKIIDRRSLKPYSSVVRKVKPGHGNRDLGVWPRVSDEVQPPRAPSATGAGAGAAPATGTSARRGAGAMRLSTRGGPSRHVGTAHPHRTAECFQCSNAGLETRAIATTCNTLPWPTALRFPLHAFPHQEYVPCLQPVVPTMLTRDVRVAPCNEAVAQNTLHLTTMRRAAHC